MSINLLLIVLFFRKIDSVVYVGKVKAKAEAKAQYLQAVSRVRLYTASLSLVHCNLDLILE